MLVPFTYYIFIPLYLIASLKCEKYPRGCSAPVEVIVGIAATVAGEDTEDHVEADGDAADDDVVVVDDVRLPVVIEQLEHQDYQLDNHLK